MQTKIADALLWQATPSLAVTNAESRKAVRWDDSWQRSKGDPSTVEKRKFGSLVSGLQCLSSKWLKLQILVNEEWDP